MDSPAVPITGAKFDAFERVVLREAGFKRPVVVFGPLADICREMLCQDYSDRYEVARNDMNHPDASAKKRKGTVFKYFLFAGLKWKFEILVKNRDFG